MAGRGTDSRDPRRPAAAHDAGHRFELWWLIPDQLLFAPLAAVFFGGGWATFLLTHGYRARGAAVLLVWLAITVALGTYARRRRFVSVGMLLFLVLVAVSIALTPLFLP